MKAVKVHILMLFMSLLAGACDVHEFPREGEEPEPGHDCVLRLRFDNSDFGYLTTVNTATRAGDAHSECDLRVTVRLYPVEEKARGEQPTRIATRDGFELYSATFSDDGTHPDVDVPLDLRPGEYQVVAWADHVKEGSDGDLYYTISDFLEVRLPGAGTKGYVHKGCDMYREAWRGTTLITVDDRGAVSLSSRAGENRQVIYLDMDRPLSRYHFITNDFRKFIETETRRGESVGGSAMTGPRPDDYRVVVKYTGYMNCAYNVISDKPIDSATGVYYEGRISRIDGDRAELAFDHMFVNHTETSVQVALELYRRSDGTRLSSTGVINVPLQRGHYTLVEGPMLTTDAGASTGIVPDYNGEYNIEIR